MATIGLCMIVKNEAHVIKRCLESVRPLIDYILVVDTGSTDGTQKVVKNYLKHNKIPGEVIEEPWKDFAYNRTFALKKLKERKEIDYSLMIDADNVIVFDPRFKAELFKANLTQDIYEIKFQTFGIFYWLPRLIHQRMDVQYKGVLHEYLEYPKEGYSRGYIEGFFDRQIQDSARNKNPNKYHDDAIVLKKALETETDPFLIARYTFYLAQSYRDCKQEKEKALARYLDRAKLGFWIEERYISLYEAAKLKAHLNYPDAEVIQTFIDAYELIPTRAESLHGAMRYCREKGKNHQGYLIGSQAILIPYPANGLFVEKWIYDYGILDEFSIVCEWTGHYKEAYDACLQLIVEKKIPETEMPRVIKNTHFVIDKLHTPVLKTFIPEKK